jgi:hypothetical protein
MPIAHCSVSLFIVNNNNFLQEKAVEATKQKEEKRKISKPKPEEQEGMPQFTVNRIAT